jgi:hypothetical protein
MHKISRVFDIRVAVCLLILTGGNLAAPSQASGDRPTPAAAVGEDIALPAGMAALAEAETSTASVLESTAWTDVTLGAVNPGVFALALTSAKRAVARGDADPTTLTVIDFSQPSTERRLWVYDLRSRQLLFEEHVSHGRNSGGNVPTLFSNEPESYKSSIGLYRAAEGYFGKHGYSLRLDGLEKGFNDRARERAIVIHGAAYVNAGTAKAQGRLGRSLGCPALRPAISAKVIDAVKDGGLVFAYYPDPTWLDESAYLN